MPIGTDPNEVFTVTTSLDPGVTFKVRAITVSERRRVYALIREADAEKNFDPANNKLNEAIHIGIIGWSLAKPLDDAGLDDELSLRQKYTLAGEYPYLVEINEYEKKVSRLRPISDAEQSAKDAAGGNATTSQAS